jgi:hypothetical protein
MPIETYNNMNKIKQYYILLYRVYKIICNKFQNNTSAELALQIIVKTINDSVGPDGIISALLVFRAYPRITNDSSLLFSITKRTKTIRKATKKIQRFYTKRQIKDIFIIRNNPNIYLILDLLIQLDIQV